MSTLPPKPVSVFCLHALLLFGLIGFWPTPRAIHPALFHGHANALFRGLGASELQLEALPAQAAGEADTRLVRSRAGRPLWSSEFELIRIAYWPSAALVALLLATPLTAPRRAAGLLVGLLLIDAFSLGRIGVEVAYLDAELARGPGLPAAGPLHLLLRTGSEALTATIPSAAFVGVCWVALARPRNRLALGSAG